jgi:hypothetical protein
MAELPSTRLISFYCRGAALTYAIYHHQRDLISHIITVCVPYGPPRATFTSLDDVVANLFPHWGYQLQFRSGEVEKVVHKKEDIKQFLLALYGGKTSAGEWGFDPRKGIALDKLGQFQPSRILNGEVSCLFPLVILPICCKNLTLALSGPRFLRK